jgi:hypothetical protein
LFGEEYAFSVEGVCFYPDADHKADKLVELLTMMPRVKRVAIWPGVTGDKTAHHVLKQNATGGLSDEGAKFILENLPDLEHLSASATLLSEEIVDELLAKPGLTSLQISQDPKQGRETVTSSYEDKDGVTHTIDHRKGSE